MSASWKVLGEFYQSVFEELSEEENRKRAADDSFLSPPSPPKKMKRSDSSLSSSKKTVHFSPDTMSMHESVATPSFLLSINLFILYLPLRYALLLSEIMLILLLILVL